MLVIELPLLLLCAFGFARLARLVRLPPLLGMIAGGLTYGLLPLPVLLPGPELSDVSTWVRLGILDLVLLRAGLGLTLRDLRRGGALGVRLGIVPMAADALALTLGARFLLGLPTGEAAVLGCLCAAISPAIVIPSILDLLGTRTRGESRRVLTALLVGAPIDNIVALLALGIALDVATAAEVSVGTTLLGLPVEILAALAAGAACGWLLAKLFGAATLPSSLRLGLVWAAALGLTAAGRALGLPFVLSVLTLGAVIRAVAPEVAADLAIDGKRAWDWCQYALFGLIGAAVNVGPLAGIGLAAAGVILLGQLGRAGGAAIASAGAGLKPKARLAAVLAYVPKATVQAALAALPLDMGLGSGGTILATAVLAIVLLAPIGTLAIQMGVSRLLPPDGG